MTVTGRRGLLRLASSSAAVAAFPSPRLASGQSLSQIRVLVGFPAGDPADVACRLFTEQMKGRYAPVVLVDNRSGAGGRIAIEHLKAAPADGATLLFTPAAMLVIYPHVFRSLSYDPIKDLQPVAQATSFPFVVTVGPRVPAPVQTLEQFIEWSKAYPDQASIGSAGPGTSSHFIGVTLARAVGAPLNYAPYRGAAPAVNDLVGGHIAATVTTPAAVVGQAGRGGVRILASSGPSRLGMLPDVPTLAELGYPQVTATEWFGFFMKSGSDPARVQQASEALQMAARSSEVSSGLRTLGLQPDPGGPAELSRTIRSDYDHWAGVVKSIGFEPQD